jgi:Protein of unknown function (DUF2924)
MSTAEERVGVHCPGRRGRKPACAQQSRTSQKWRERLKQAPPSHFNKPILVPLLAYRLQEQAYGGLKPAYKRRLRELAESFERNPNQPPKAVSSFARIKPGTRLIRQWDGQTHQVTVAEEGFEYKGERYKSLSEIARLITGTRWSGPLFFGLKQSQKDQARS